MCAKKENDRRFLSESPRQNNPRPSTVWKKAAELLFQKEIKAEIPLEDDEEETNPDTRIDLNIQEIDADAYDCKPVRRRRDGGGGFRGFQRYQFHLAIRGGGRMSREDGWDPGQRPGHSPVFDIIPEIVGSISASGIAAISNSFRDKKTKDAKQGFSVEQAEKYDYLCVPRTPTAQTFWVFQDSYFKDFIVRRITDEAVAAIEKGVDANNIPAIKELAKLWGSALKAYYNLYLFFRAGQSDAGTVDDPELEIPRGLWFDHPAAIQRARSRLMEEGQALYGTILNPQPFEVQERTERLWPLFAGVRRLVSRPKPH